MDYSNIDSSKGESEFVVFIDESGDLEIDTKKPGASNLFISVAVVLKRENLESADQQLSKIAIDYFRGGEIKSSVIAKRYQRRLNILKEIAKIDFFYFALVVNKKKIYEDSGLSFKPSFYKYFNSQIFDKLADLGQRIEILADQYKGKKFYAEFSNYLERKVNSKLKLPLNHRFDSSTNQPGIQLADFIAGTLSYCLDPDKKNDFSEQFRESLSKKETVLDVWPDLFLSSIDLPGIESSEFDKIIMEVNIEKAMIVLDELREAPEKENLLKHAILNELISIEMRSIANKWRIYKTRNELLKLSGFSGMASRNFQAKVVRPLRESGIIIAGTTNGYKIATSLRDIHEDIEDDEAKIIPTIKALLSIRKTVKIITSNELDILNSYDSQLLKAVIMAFIKESERQALAEREEVAD